MFQDMRANTLRRTFSGSRNEEIPFVIGSGIVGVDGIGSLSEQAQKSGMLYFGLGVALAFVILHIVNDGPECREGLFGDYLGMVCHALPCP